MRLRGAAAGTVLALTGCSIGALSGFTGPPDDAGADAAPPAVTTAAPTASMTTTTPPQVTDAGTDTSAGFDAGFDAAGDAGTDAGFDAGTDAGFDAGFDAGTDAGFDAGTDAGVDAGFDAGTDAGTDAGVDSGLPVGSVLVYATSFEAAADATDCGGFFAFNGTLTRNPAAASTGTYGCRVCLAPGKPAGTAYTIDLGSAANTTVKVGDQYVIRAAIKSPVTTTEQAFLNFRVRGSGGGVTDFASNAGLIPATAFTTVSFAHTAGGAGDLNIYVSTEEGDVPGDCMDVDDIQLYKVK